MDQASADVQGKAQQPEHDKDYEDCPKHRYLSWDESARLPGR
jgi:hypothetical protein